MFGVQAGEGIGFDEVGTTAAVGPQIDASRVATVQFTP